MQHNFPKEIWQQSHNCAKRYASIKRFRIMVPKAQLIWDPWRQSRNCHRRYVLRTIVPKPSWFCALQKKESCFYVVKTNRILVALGLAKSCFFSSEKKHQLIKSRIRYNQNFSFYFKFISIGCILHSKMQHNCRSHWPVANRRGTFYYAKCKAWRLRHQKLLPHKMRK